MPDSELDVDEPPNHPDDPRTSTGAARLAGLEPGTEEYNDFVGEFTETPGALLFPSRMPRHVVEGVKRRYGDQYNAQHQQNPLPGKGGMMAEPLAKVRRYVEDPFLLAAGTSSMVGPDGKALGPMELLMPVDASFGSKGATASNVALQVWGRPHRLPGWMFLLDSVAERMSYVETELAIQDMKRKWPKVRTVLIEKKANGAALLDRLDGRINATLEPYDPEGSKEVRAAVLAANMRTGTVFVPEGDPRDPNVMRNAYTPWIDAWIHELSRFPGGARDDQVDASSMAVLFWTEGDLTAVDDFEDRFRRAVDKVGGGMSVGGATFHIPGSGF